MLSEVDDKTRVRRLGGDGESRGAYDWVADAEALFAEFKAKGALVVHPPVDRDVYGNREFCGAHHRVRPRHRRS